MKRLAEKYWKIVALWVIIAAVIVIDRGSRVYITYRNEWSNQDLKNLHALVRESFPDATAEEQSRIECFVNARFVFPDK